MNETESSDFIDGLTPAEMRIMLAGLSGYAPAAFALSVATVNRMREVSQ